ncbi:WD40-repeat-containing domain protein [Cladochytrium replicatum]|nr:WD40-repeat-containing domain protein [Cladochytrium replicatum]
MSGKEKGIALEDLDEIDDNFDIGEGGRHARAEQQAILAELERKKLARSIAVPTDDKRVRERLRELGEPQTCFGEGPAERRDRLRFILSLKAREAGEDVSDSDSEDESSSDEEEDEEFYTVGEEDLKDARRTIAVDSLKRAKQRTALHMSEQSIPLPKRKKAIHEWYSHLKTYNMFSSQFGDERPLTYCAFAPNSQLLVTGSFGGQLKLWSVPKCDPVASRTGHRDRVSGIAFHPKATLSQTKSELNLVSGASDGSVNLWSLSSNTPIGKLEGHEQRVARVDFHPSGKYVATASFDQTWRLWDAERQTELLTQEGHSREVFAIGFQRDGALVASGGKDAIGRVWDIRSGRSIMLLQGHIKPVITLDWSPNGYQLTTGGEDNTMRVWDLRQVKCTNVVPAHKSVVSQLRYWDASQAFLGWWGKGGSSANGGAIEDAMEVDAEEDISQVRLSFMSGTVVVSSSFDGTTKLWSVGDWKQLKVMGTTESRISCCDISAGILIVPLH